MPPSKSRESLEASITFLPDEDDCDIPFDDEGYSICVAQMALSDDNWEGYSTPTGSSLQLHSHCDSDTGFFDAPNNRALSTPQQDDEEDQVLLQNTGPATTHQTQQQKMSEMPETTLEELTRRNMELQEENDRLRRQFSPHSSKSFEDYEAEIVLLKEQLHEANSYVDQVDVEAEQQYTELSGEIDELCTLVEKREGEIKQLKEQISDQKKEIERWSAQCEQQKSTHGRQSEIIESIREECDSMKEKMKEASKDKERLNAEIYALNEKFEAQKGSILAKEVMLSMELEDVQRQLNKQKEILACTSMSDAVNRCERKVLELENQISEREVIIHTQQAIINRLRSGSPPSGHRALMSHSGGSSSESFNSREPIIDENSKHTIYNYLTSDRNTQLANIYAIGRLLDLSSQQEQYLERYLSGRSSRFY